MMQKLEVALIDGNTEVHIHAAITLTVLQNAVPFAEANLFMGLLPTSEPGSRHLHRRSTKGPWSWMTLQLAGPAKLLLHGSDANPFPNACTCLCRSELCGVTHAALACRLIRREG